MAAHAIDDQTWHILLRTLRDDPTENVTEAARQARISYPTARKAYRDGYPNAKPPRAPIAKILEEERVQARATVNTAVVEDARRAALEEAAQKRAEAKKAREDVVEARRQEGAMVRGMRGSVLGMIGASASVVRGAMKLGESIGKDLALAAEGDVKMTMKAKQEAITNTTLWLTRLASAAGEVVKMERLLLGEPTEILGHKNLANVGFEEAVKELEGGSETARRIRERAERRKAHLSKVSLTVLEGGRKSA